MSAGIDKSSVDLPSTNLVDVLRYRTEQRPDAFAFTFLRDGDADEEHLSFEALDKHARLIGAWLQQHHAAGQRVLLLYPPGIQFITAFFGCLYAGAVAVPAYPPRMNDKLTRLQAIAFDAQPAHVLTNTATITRLRLQAAELNGLKSLQWLDTDELLQSVDFSWRPPVIDDHTLAFIQYTSGSTGQPKGVMITHRNLLHNQRMMKNAFRHPEYGRIMGWLPLYHDMGLIGNVLHTIYTGSWCVLMSPVAFIQRPVRWLNAITRYKAHASGGPSFAYDLCTRKVTDAQRATLDLSSWRVAFNGAEPVRADVLERFAETFESCGFRRDAFHPCYGLAEATLVVSGRPANGPAVTQTILSEPLEQRRVIEASGGETGTRTFVGCGESSCGQQIKIVDPDILRECAPDVIGEVWVRGDSVAQGYWNKPEQTAETFQARLAQSGEGPFLRTGDLGFLHDGELFISGRLKDLIIINGRNHYPQDIERTIEQSYAGVRPGCVAAFGVEIDGEERLVTVLEIERANLRTLNARDVEDAIREAVSVNHELELHAVVLLKPGSIPKTTSGKLQRQLCAKMFLAGDFVPVTGQLSAIESPVETLNPRMQFSLLYFSSNEAGFTDNKYELLIEGAKFADQHDFTAIWVPERHFHAFGGLYPNPSVLGSALAMITARIRIRAGSVVLPLQNPIRVAEEWSVVDNLSRGRVDLAFARGWNPNDFVLAPNNYTNSTEILFNELQTVRRLWKGETIKLPNGKGEEIEIKIYPLPKQRELKFWITCSGGVERFTEAGACGANVLTALLFQSIDELAEKIAAYRDARAKHGHDRGHVTLMLHTFIDHDIETVRRTVRSPFIDYLKTSVSLWRHGSKNLEDLNQKQQEELLEFAFERYFQTSALFGTPTGCLSTVTRLREVGVDEIACLIDFGIDTKRVLLSLEALNELRIEANQAHKEAQEVTIEAASMLVAASEDHELVRWLQDIIVTHLATSLEVDPQKVPLDRNFYSLGVSSLKAVEIMDVLSEHLALSLSPTILFEAPTVPALARYFARTHAETLRAKMQNGTGVLIAETQHREPQGAVAEPHKVQSVREGDVAVIGMSCRFPQAPDLDAFWKLLRDGKDAVTEVPSDHWDWRLFYDPDQSNGKKTYSRWGGFLNDIDQFDPLFFNISHREARLMDPQQRIFLEVSWETFEHAGYSMESLAKKEVGVFVGSSNNGYYHHIAHALTAADHAAGIGNQNAIIANRISFLLNLRGPSILVDTMCSSSLVALHLALQSLREGECEVALAGGVNVLLSPEYYVAMSRMKAHAPDGHCKTFDHRANGIVFGEGAGAVLLKPLSNALKDGDAIYAVIKGSAVNHGGQTNGLTAPNPEAQAQLISRALERAGVNADSISYLEAHGTGTSLGDPIEIEGASRAFRAHTDRKQFCAIGSVKTNIGHLEPAAGISGLIKVILSMQNRQLPPTLHFEKANPIINFEESPFRVNTELRAWDTNGPRRAGVSSFGIGGSNAHVVLEEAPPVSARVNQYERPLHVLTLSAKSENALLELAGRYVTFLLDHPEVALPDICYTANVGRSHFMYRLAAIAATRERLVQQLQAFIAREKTDGLYHGEAHAAGIFSLEEGMIAGRGLAAVAASGNGASVATVNSLEQVVISGHCERVEQVLAQRDGSVVVEIPSLRNGGNDWQQLLDSVCALYVAGVEINWNGFEGDNGRRRVALPTYPFERERCWIDPPPQNGASDSMAVVKDLPDWFYEVQWRRKERHSDTPRAIAAQPGSWIILADKKGVGRALTASLESRGERCFTINSSTGEDFDRLLEECIFNPCRGIIHLFSLDSYANEDLTLASLEQAQRLGCASLIRLVQALESHNKDASRIWIVTEGAQSIGPHVDVSSVAQSTIWGLGKVLSLERPQLWGGLIDLEPNTPAADQAARIVDEINFEHHEDQVVFRDGHRYVPRLARIQMESTQSLTLRSDATYMITGGLGSLGLEFARWLVDQGARYLVLVSRRPQMKSIKALESMGASVQVVSADVADEARMTSFVNELNPPLCGIIHAAGVQTRQTISEMDLDQFNDVLRPKVAGGWALHRATAGMDLDFMIFFSSMSSVTGSVELAHYAAANQFLDSLAQHRRAHGMAALSVNWGPWAGEGMVTSELGELFEKLGVRPLARERAVQALATLAQCDSPQVTVADIDWQTFKPLYESRRLRPLLAEIVIEEKVAPQSEPVEPSSLTLELRAARQSERKKLLRAHINGEVASILGQDLSRLPLKDTGFFEMGMDSLMAMELKRRLESSLGCSLAPTLTFDYPTIDSLVDYILEKVLDLDATAPAPEWLRSQTAAQVLATVEELSDEEALLLLEQKLQVLEGNM